MHCCQKRPGGRMAVRAEFRTLITVAMSVSSGSLLSQWPVGRWPTNSGSSASPHNLPLDSDRASAYSLKIRGLVPFERFGIMGGLTWGAYEHSQQVAYCDRCRISPSVD